MGRHSHVQQAIYTSYRSRYGSIIPNYRFNRECCLQVPWKGHACQINKGQRDGHVTYRG